MMKEKPRPEYSVGTKAVHAAAYLVEQQAKRAERAEAEREKLAAEWGLLKIELHHRRKERDDARAVARAILQMAQEQTGRQVVGDMVLEAHPWLKGEGK